jgi:hypothetical protein
MTRCFQSVSKIVMLTAALLLCGTADARRGDPPRSATLKVAAIERIPALELEAVDRTALLAEDEARAAAGPGPLRIAAPSDVKITPAEDGVWETLPDGGRLWRLRIHAPNATDLNFGFTRYRLPPGATLHILSEEANYFEGPFTSEDNKAHGELWTPIVPGERAVVELYVPPAPAFETELQLGRIGRGYRDFLGLDRRLEKQGSCNIDVVCPEGDAWRDEIRSVALYTFTVPLGTGFCTGTLIRDVPNTSTPHFLSAFHCGVDTDNDQTVVIYWNFESSSCGDLDEWPAHPQPSQNGSTFRASREDNDMLLLELDDEPDGSVNAYYSGWDARTTTSPGGSVSIHHPDAGAKAISLNDDALTTRPNCIASSGAGTHWNVDNWETGTTEPGSSGGGLWDPATHRLVGYLSGGTASCANPSGFDCFGRMAIGWDGSSDTSRLHDWLDPTDTGTRFVDGANGGGGGGGGGGSDCGNAFYDNGTTDTAVFFGGGFAGDPDYMFAVKFELADFGFTPGNTQITGFCASNQKSFTGGPWPNEVFIYPDSGGLPDDSVILGQGTILTGDGGGWYEVTLSSPVTLNGDFWLVNRGDSQWEGEDFNMERDIGPSVSQSYLSGTGVANLGLEEDGNYMLRATLQQGGGGGGGGGYGDGAYDYFLAAIVHSPGVGGALWRSKVGVLNYSGSSADVTFTYFWKNGPTTVSKSVVKTTVADGALKTWDDAAVSLFGITTKSSGSVLINSTTPIIVTARTYNVGDDGSFGSFMPGVSVADAVSTGGLGVLTQLTGNDDFRTNVGMVNLSDKSCQVRVRVKSAVGTNVGSAEIRTLAAYSFDQINDVFAETGAGSRNNAYATVEVLTSGCEVWAYGAVIDGTNAFPGTNDATTFPLTVVD